MKKNLSQTLSKKARPVYFEIDIPIFNSTIIVSFESFINLRKRLYSEFKIDIDKNVFGGGDGIVIDLENEYQKTGFILLAIDNFYKRIKTKTTYTQLYCTLVHEVLHATTTILNNRGVPINFENDETIAYLQEFILSEILTKMKR